MSHRRQQRQPVCDPVEVDLILRDYVIAPTDGGCAVIGEYSRRNYTCIQRLGRSNLARYASAELARTSS